MEPGTEPVELQGLTRRFAQMAVPGVTEPRISTFQPSEDVGVNPVPPARPNARFRSLAWQREKELPMLEIEEVELGLYSTEMIDTYAVINVTNPDDEGPESVNDPRLGPQNNSEICETCQRDILSCTGHMGKIVIPRLLHPLIVAKIILVLSCVCNDCNSLLVTKEELEQNEIHRMTGTARLQAIKDYVHGLKRKCRRFQNVVDPMTNKCSPMPVYINNREKKDDFRLTYTYPGAEKSSSEYFRTPDQVFDILNHISDEDSRLLGFMPDQHPRDMILERLIVIPYCARPNLFQGDRNFRDHLTVMYSDIIKTVRAFNDPAASEATKHNTMQNLYFKVTRFMRNDGKYSQGGSKPYTDVVKRLQGKNAIIRFNIMGKRVNFAGRTVAGPAAYLRVDEIGVPRIMTTKLTRPIPVLEYNRAELQAQYDNNEFAAITPTSGPNGGKRMLREYFQRKNPDYQLQLGDIFERNLRDGDIVLVNRQPTLHKQNILALKARIIDDRVLRINLSITTPLNADFDGDELNIHVPQTIEAYAEAEQLLSIYQNLMNAQNNKPIMAIVYNALTGAYLLSYPEHVMDTYPKQIEDLRSKLDDLDEDTKEYKSVLKSLNTKVNEVERMREKTMIDPIVFNQAIEWVVKEPQFATLKERVVQKGITWGSGRSLFSSTLPEDFYYNNKGVVIEDGVLISGLLSKDVLGTTNGSIIAEMVKQLGGIVTVDFMSDVQFVLKDFLQQHGFSVGINDCLPGDEATQRMIEEAIDTAKMKVLSLSGKTSNEIIAEQKERKIMESLDITKGLGDKLVQDQFQPDNAILIMANSGAKGSGFNAAQMSSLLGQTKVSGKRIPANLAGNRSLPIFQPNDPDPKSRGFCGNSFGSGLDPAEYFFHAQGGREGLTDTAVNTSQTGFLQHQIIRSAEDVHISPDGSVRIDSGAVVQFVYGDDGFDASQLGEVKIRGENIPFFRNIYQLADKLNKKYGPQ